METQVGVFRIPATPLDRVKRAARTEQAAAIDDDFVLALWQKRRQLAR